MKLSARVECPVLTHWVYMLSAGTEYASATSLLLTCRLYCRHRNLAVVVQVIWSLCIMYRHLCQNGFLLNVC